MTQSYVVRTFDDFKALVKAGLVKDTGDVRRIIAHTYPDEGLDGQVVDHYIGFNLCRYTYHDKIAAELHALLDMMNGRQGASYGCPFDPHVKTTKATDDNPESYTVWTG